MGRAPSRRAANLLRGLLLVAVAACWILPGWDVFLRASLSAVLLGGLAGALLARRLPNHDPILLDRAEAVWSILFLGHFLGHAFDLYGTWAPYDKALHASGGVGAALAAYWLAMATPLFWDEGRRTPFRVFWVCASVVLGAGVAVELVEYASDATLRTGTQDHPALTRLDDTMTDLFAEGVAGLIVGGALAWRAARPARTDAPTPAPPGSATGGGRDPPSPLRTDRG